MLDCGGGISKCSELRLSNEIRNNRRNSAVQRVWCTSITKVEHPSPSMDKVFETPELLENILTYIDPYHLLSVRGVSKTIQKLINTSPRIRTAMCRETQATTVSNIPSFPYRIRAMLRIDNDTSGIVSIIVGEFSRTSGIHSYTRTLRGSATLESILIAQPSPGYASVYQRCYCNNSHRHSLRTRVFNRGLTFKDIFKLIDAHRSCSLCCGVRYWLIKASYNGKRREYELRKTNGISQLGKQKPYT